MSACPLAHPSAPPCALSVSLRCCASGYGPSGGVASSVGQQSWSCQRTRQHGSDVYAWTPVSEDPQQPEPALECRPCPVGHLFVPTRAHKEQAGEQAASCRKHNGALALFCWSLTCAPFLRLPFVVSLCRCAGPAVSGAILACPPSTFASSVGSDRCLNCPSCCACNATTGGCLAGSAAGCSIDGICWEVGASEPHSGGCKTCDPSQSAASWSVYGHSVSPDNASVCSSRARARFHSPSAFLPLLMTCVCASPPPLLQVVQGREHHVRRVVLILLPAETMRCQWCMPRRGIVGHGVLVDV